MNDIHLFNWWRRQTFRRRYLITTLFGLLSTPSVFMYARSIYSELAEAGVLDALFWKTILGLTYLVVIRSWIDLLTDVNDILRGDFSILGSDQYLIDGVALNRSFSVLKRSSMPKESHKLLGFQNLLCFWLYFERKILLWFIPITSLIAISKSGYFDGLSKSAANSIKNGNFSFGVLQLLLLMSFGLIFLCSVSTARRTDVGLIPIIFRGLGLNSVAPRKMRE